MGTSRNIVQPTEDSQEPVNAERRNKVLPPTPEEIKAATAAIRAEWSAVTYRARAPQVANDAVKMHEVRVWM